ncbi:MAG: amidohydrolase family protein [Bacilli bacterium]
MSFDLRNIPLVDHHCHTLMNATRRTELHPFIRITSEAPTLYPLEDLEETVTYEAMKRIVEATAGEKVDTAADFERVFNDIDYDGYCRTLFEGRGYEKLFIDTGFSPGSGLSQSDLSRITGTTVYQILRLEQVAEQLCERAKTFSEWWEELLHTVRSARRNGYIGVKSVVAYRTGLGVGPVTREDAEAAYGRWRLQESRRLTDASLLHFILWEVAPHIIEQHLPLQFHTGYGDPDEDLLKGNPLLLRSFLDEFCTRGLAVTLLHTYPYHREAGYLASVYPGVYFDVSLIIPLGVTSARSVLQEALELTPMSRFLFASDAHTRPELFALAADVFRDALLQYLTNSSITKYVGGDKIERWASMILGGNARALYLKEW